MVSISSPIIISILSLLFLFIIIMFFVRKNKRRTHFQSKIVNDTSYNIASKENAKDADKDEVESYLKIKKEGDSAPLNRGDYEIYNDTV